MNRRIDALIGRNSGINTGYVVDAKSIKRRVNARLNSESTEKQNYIRQKFLKAVLITAVLFALLTGGVLAGHYFNLLNIFFAGDTSPFEEFVQTPKQSVTDGRFKLTLEQVLTAKYQMFVVYSIEGLTEDAADALMKEDFITMDTISFAPLDTKQASFRGFGQRELKELREGNKRFWALEGIMITNEQEANFYLRLNAMQDAQKITITPKINVSTTEYTFVSPQGNTYLKMSPLGVRLETPQQENRDFTNVYFRLKDESLRTYNEMLRTSIMGPDESVYESNSTFDSLFYEIGAPKDIVTVIVGETEYDLKDVTKPKTTHVDPRLHPFSLQPVVDQDRLWLPLEDFCLKIGAAYMWDAASQTATVIYHGTTYTLTAGSNEVGKDTEKIALAGDGTGVFLKDGVLVVNPSFAQDILHMQFDLQNTFHDTGEPTEKHEQYWIIIP